MKIVTSDGGGSNSKYVPPAISNGDLSLQIDYQGMQLQKSYCGMTPNIRRAGFRHDTHS